MPERQARRCWAFERGTLWVRECDGNDTIRVLPRVRATLVEAHPEAADVLARAMGHADAAEVLERFSGERRCFVALVDGSIASYGWVSLRSEMIGELERPFRMLPDEAYVWDCATVPPHQGQRLYCALLSHIAATLCHDGVGRIWIGASASNTPSIRGFATAGFQPVLTMTYARLFGLRHTWMAASASAAPELFAHARAALSG